MRHLADWGGSAAARPVDGGGYITQPAAPSYSSSSSHGWDVGKAVLYCGIAFVALAWASACICLVRHCIRRRRVGHAVGQSEQRQENNGTHGGSKPAGPAPRYFKPEIPVIIVGPDNSFDLGVKDEQACPAGATSSAASWRAGDAHGAQHPLKALRMPRRAGLTGPDQATRQLAASPPSVLAREQRYPGFARAQEGAQGHPIQLAHAGVGVARQRNDADGDSSATEDGGVPTSICDDSADGAGSSCGASSSGSSTSGHDSAASSSGGSTSRAAAGAWGYEPSNGGR